MSAPSIALVTGSARGLGRAIATALHQQGQAQRIVRADVLFDRDQQPQAENFGNKDSAQHEICLHCDVTDPNSVDMVFEQAKYAFGAYPNIVVANAGILYPTSFLDISFPEWKKVHDVMTHGTFLTMRTGLRKMVAACKETDNHPPHPMRVVTLGSTAGKTISTLGGAHYTSSKHAVLGMTRAAAREMGHASGGKITVNSVCPGLFRTDMTADMIKKTDWKGYREKAEAENDSARPDPIDHHAPTLPAQRIGEPEDVANLVAFLCSDKASYITGACLDISGGELIGH